MKHSSWSSVSIFRWLAVALVSVFFVGASGAVGIRNGNFNAGDADWTLHPGGGHPGPRILQLGGAKGIWIGRSPSSGVDGHQESSVSQTFQCGESPERWCTVTFDANNEQQDSELLKVTLQSGPRSRVGYLKISSMQRHVLSVKGCTENAVRFEMTPGRVPKLQSTVNVPKIKSECTNSDRTNSGGTPLFDAEGKPLKPQP